MMPLLSPLIHQHLPFSSDKLPIGLCQHVFELRMNLSLDDTERFFGKNLRFVQVFCIVLAKVDDNLREFGPVHTGGNSKRIQ